jgi:chromosome segregation ATPase
MMALFKRSAETLRMVARRESYLARLHEIFDELDSETVESASVETSDRVTEEIASKFAEAFLFAFGATGMEKGQTQTLRVALSDISGRVDRVTAELSSQPRKFDSVILRLAAQEEPLSEHQNLGAEKEERLRQLEARTKEHQEAVQQQLPGFSTGLETPAQAVEAQERATAEVTEASQTRQKRLDAQADVTRSAHSDVQECDERLTQFRAALEKAREAFASMATTKALPEGI